MFIHLKAKNALIQNGVISYLEIGTGIPLIMVNGFTNSFRDWNPVFIESLSKNFRLLMINIRGVGFSYSNNNDHTIEKYAEDIIQFCNYLKLETFAILGHSMGGYIAQEVARSSPHQILFLILSSTRMGGEFRTMAEQWVIDSLTCAYKTEEEREEANLNILCPSSAKEDLKQKFKDCVHPYKDDAIVPNRIMYFQNQARSLWLEEFGHKQREYKEFCFPTLILCGNKDVIIPPENSVQLSRFISNSWLIRVPHAGHALIWQFPEYCSKIISSFFSLSSNNESNFTINYSKVDSF